LRRASAEAPEKHCSICSKRKRPSYSLICTASGCWQNRNLSHISISTFLFTGGGVSYIGSSCTSQLGCLVRQSKTKNSSASGVSGELRCNSPLRSTQDPAFGQIRLLERTFDASLICRLDGGAHKRFHTLAAVHAGKEKLWRNVAIRCFCRLRLLCYELWSNRTSSRK
jgi:hypothetical protein